MCVIAILLVVFFYWVGLIVGVPHFAIVAYVNSFTAINFYQACIVNMVIANDGVVATVAQVETFFANFKNFVIFKGDIVRPIYHHAFTGLGKFNIFNG